MLRTGSQAPSAAQRQPSGSAAITWSMQWVSAATSSGSMAGKQADAQLVAAELAVGLGVDDAVAPQHAATRRWRRCGRRGRWWRPRGCDAIGSVTKGVATSDASAHAVDGLGRTVAAAGRPLEAAVARGSTRPGGRRGTPWPAPACCRSGPCGSSRGRCRGRARRASSGRWPSSARCARWRRASTPPARDRRRWPGTSGGRSSRRRSRRRRTAARRRPTWRRRRRARRRRRPRTRSSVTATRRSTSRCG